MIEPYYAAWLNVRNEQMKKERLFDAIRASWKDMTFLERMAFVSFVAVFVIASSLGGPVSSFFRIGCDGLIDAVPRCDAHGDACGGLFS